VDHQSDGAQAERSEPLTPERAASLTGELMGTLDAIFSVFEADRTRNSASRITTGPVHAAQRDRSVLS
jgi:hypothetical protein